MKTVTRRGWIALGLLIWGSSLALAADIASPTGRWDAVVVISDGTSIPFRFEIEGTGDAVKGSFFDGDKKITSKPGTFKDGALTVSFDQYATTLQATLKDGQLEGSYLRGSRGKPYPFHAVRHVAAARAGSDVPKIAGVWKVNGFDTTKAKGEKAWRLIVRQSGPDVSAAVLRIDGDTGTLTGNFQQGTFVLSHFSGARPSLFEVTPGKDGTIEILQNKKVKLTAMRIEDPRAKEAPDPTDPLQHTRWKDPNERFRFSANDLNGKPVTDADARLQGKVILVSITGSWCPNCRDEAPFLANLYKKYRKQGLEIVALSFEEADQLANPTRLRNFIKEYGVEYTVRLAGDPDKLTEVVPQAENLNSFPTSFLLGRDGKVRAVHAGFPSPASGAFYTEARRDLTAQVERLLAERPAGTQE
jgi:thiol-disulfide isomerase/thioredoxin